MRVAYHPLVQRDVNAILRHYEAISPALGDEFWNELLRVITRIEENPDRSHPADRGLRRVNLRRFPYHILFRRTAVRVRIVVLRHHDATPTRG